MEPGGLAETALRVYPVHEDELEMMEVKNLDGLTPLLWCAAHGRTEAARWCVANGADIPAVDAKGRLPAGGGRQGARRDRRGALRARQGQMAEAVMRVR